MVVKRELNAWECQNNVLSPLEQSKSAFITIKIGNIKDFIKEFEQNTAGIQKWKMVTYKLGRYCMRVFWPSLVRFGEIQ